MSRELLNPTVTEMRQAQPEDVIVAGNTRFEVVAVENDHVWGLVLDSAVPGQCCRICGLMRRRDGKSNPCRGRPKITFRDPSLDFES